MKKMSKEEAYQLVAQVCAAWRGTLAEHVKLQTAIKMLQPEEKDLTAQEESENELTN